MFRYTIKACFGCFLGGRSFLDIFLAVLETEPRDFFADTQTEAQHKKDLIQKIENQK